LWKLENRLSQYTLRKINQEVRSITNFEDSLKTALRQYFEEGVARSRLEKKKSH